MKPMSLVLLVGLAACAAEPETSEETEAGAADAQTPLDGEVSADAALQDLGPDSAADASASDVALPDAEPPPDLGLPDRRGDLVGPWALVTRVATIQTVSIPGMEPYGSVTHSYALVDVRREGEALMLTERYCHVEITSDWGMGVPVLISDAWTRSMEPFEAPLVPSAEGMWRRPEVVQAVGARLEDPVDERLPTEVDDPRVFDQDGDGHPGVTSEVVGIGEIYLVRRERYLFVDLSFDESGRLSGRMDDTSEQVVLGASNAALDVPITIEPDPDPETSVVELVPLAEPLDCDTLVERSEALFPPEE